RLSALSFGVPQGRERVYIVAHLAHLPGVIWPQALTEIDDIGVLLDDQPPEAKKLSPSAIAALETWQRFLNLYPKNLRLPSWPIWSGEFGANYPFETASPHQLGPRRLVGFLGTHGVPLRNLAPRERLSALPSYSRVEEAQFPRWKVRFIQLN